LQLLAAHGVIAEYCAIDMALHADDVIDEFKERQARAITTNLTSEHTEPIARRAHDDADTIRKLANPLFVQAFLSIHLTLNMLDVCINYFAQRRPDELGRPSVPI
jgi:phosphopantetheinyl transferase